MRGPSREALAAGRDRLEALLSSTSVDPVAVGEDLFAVTALLAGNAGLRRALTDPSRDGATKAGLLERLLGGKVGGPSLDLLAGMVRGRWSSDGDLTDAVEELAITAVLVSAERAGTLDTVEDELFRFARTIGGDPRLRDAVSTRTAGTERKADLVHRLLDGRADPTSIRLAVQATVAPRGMRTEQVLERYVEAAARRRQQLVAEVVAAVPLTAAQRERLAAALRRVYGRPVRLNLDVDPEVLGGLRVQIGGELIEGTMSARVDEARRRLAS